MRGARVRKVKRSIKLKIIGKCVRALSSPGRNLEHRCNYIQDRRGPSLEPCGTPDVTGSQSVQTP